MRADCRMSNGAAPRQTSWTGIRGRPGVGAAAKGSSSSSSSIAIEQAASSGQPAASFPAASLQDGSSRSGSRPAAKPVLTPSCGGCWVGKYASWRILLFGEPRGWGDHRGVPVTTGSITGHPSEPRRWQPTIRLYRAICKGADTRFVTSWSGAFPRRAVNNARPAPRPPLPGPEREENP